MRARRAQQSINAPSCHLKKYNAACAKINRRTLCAMDKVMYETRTTPRTTRTNPKTTRTTPTLERRHAAEQSRLHMYVCMHVCMYVCLHVCVYVCMDVRMCECTYVCVCMNVCGLPSWAQTKKAMSSNDTKGSPLAVHEHMQHVCVYVDMYVCMYVCTKHCMTEQKAEWSQAVPTEMLRCTEMPRVVTGGAQTTEN